MEDYAAKMSLKTDAALREYVVGRYQYREEAVLAALDELRRRGQPAPEEEAIRPELEAAARQHREKEAAEAERQHQAELASELEEEAAEGPALYSRGTIIAFSMVTMLASGILLGLNFIRLRQWRGLALLGLFIVVYLLGCLAFFSWALPRFGLSPYYKLVFDLPAVLIYVLWFWPRFIGRGPTRSRSWVPPLLLCLLALWSLDRMNSYLLQHQPREVREQLEKMMPK